MRRLVLGLALVVAASPAVRAQTETTDLLRQAQALYEQLEIERALPLLRQIVSPSWPHEITTDQRVQAYTYLGASLALTGVRDSALLYFRAAIEHDTFIVVSTHPASFRVELRSVDEPTTIVLFHDVNDGLREVPWNGLLSDGHLAPPGRYALAVVGRSQLLGRSDSMRVYFTVAHATPPLEDTL